MGRFVTIICLLLLADPASAAGAGFARLADGTVVEVRNRTAQELTFSKADGSPGQVAIDQVDGWLATRQADRLVDQLLPKVGVKEKHDEVRKQLATLQMAAVPRIIHHLENGDERRRMEAIGALQFVWSTAAEKPVRAAVNDENESVRSIAILLVQTRISGDHTDLLDTAAGDRDPHVSGTALFTLLSNTPDPARLATALENRDLWPFLHSLLPRYHDRARFGEITHRMLATGRADEQASALCALLHQYDLDARTEAEVLDRLRDFEPALRMRAAEYLRWHGMHTALPPLRSALGSEKNLHCRAVMRAAVEAITLRQRLFSRPLSDTTHEWSGDFETASAAALAAWRDGPATLALRLATLELLGSREITPFYKFDGRTTQDKTEDRYIALVNHAAGFPGPAALRAARRTSGDQAPPPTPALVPPVRNYFDPERNSFGLFTGDYDGPFKHSHHVGDDVAFHQQHETVVAIGDGLVRHALTASSSWGGIVILEHRDPTNDQLYCSLYAHLGPLVCVKTGDTVVAGAMLGSLGRTYTRATGGYQSHLHFGIHLAPFEGNWITGYLSPRHFKETEHAWIDPQPFIRARMK